jgi:hypothetical protein
VSEPVTLTFTLPYWLAVVLDYGLRMVLVIGLAQLLTGILELLENLLLRRRHTRESKP